MTYGKYVDEGPWMTCVYVPPEHRNKVLPLIPVLLVETMQTKGIASRLAEHMMKRAAKAGVVKLWLFTWTAAHIYERLGWKKVDQVEFAGHDVTVMSIDIGATSLTTQPLSESGESA